MAAQQSGRTFAIEEKIPAGYRGRRQNEREADGVTAAGQSESRGSPKPRSGLAQRA